MMNENSDILFTLGKSLFAHAYDIMLVWMIFMVVLFIALLIRFTFGVGFSKENPNPHINETFAMPPGVFRGFITMTLLFLVTLIEVINLNIPLLDGNGQMIAKNVGDMLYFPSDRHHDLMVAFQMMLAFYFGSKVMNHVIATDKEKTKILAEKISANDDSFNDPEAQG